MDLFIEKEFAENFQIEYYPEKETEIQKIINSIFAKYTKINWFLNDSEDYVVENELLSKLSDSNLNFKVNVDFDKLFDKHFIPNKQTLVLTEKPRVWFPLLKEKGALCFSYDNYEKVLQKFIDETHFKVDLSDSENIPIDWQIFKESDILLLLFQQRCFSLHIDGLDAAFFHAERRTNIDTEITAGAIFYIDLQGIAYLWKSSGAYRGRSKSFWRSLQMLLIIKFCPDHRMRTYKTAITALNAQVRDPFRNKLGNIALFPDSCSGRISPVYRQLADGQLVAFTCHHFGGDGLHEWRCFRWYYRRHLQATANLFRHINLEKMRQ